MIWKSEYNGTLLALCREYPKYLFHSRIDEKDDNYVDIGIIEESIKIA